MTTQNIDLQLSTVVTSPGVWMTEDSEKFHTELCRHTKINDKGELILDHCYFNNQDIQIIEQIERMFQKDFEKGHIKGIINKNNIVYYLEARNGSCLDSNYCMMYYLLLGLQEKTGFKFTSKQLNNKHINTRSRISVPFAYLHEKGYFTKATGILVSKDAIKLDDIVRVRWQATNMDVKNIPLIKGLFTFMTKRDGFWSDETQCVPRDECVRDSSETIKWIKAMVGFHGFKMVKFLDECVSNLLNTYLVELIDQGRHDGSLPMIWKKSPFESKLKVFNALLEDLKALGKTSELNDDTNEITRPSKRKSGNTESKDVKRHCDDSNRDNSVNNLASFVDWVVEPGYDSNLARAGEQILMNAGVDFILPGNSTASSIATGHYAIQSSKTDLNTSSSNSIVDSYASLQLPFFDISNIF